MWDHSREAFDHASLVLPAISDTAGSLSSARSLRTPNGMVAEVCRLTLHELHQEKQTQCFLGARRDLSLESASVFPPFVCLRDC